MAYKPGWHSILKPMQNFSREQRGKAFDSLPADLKTVITSNTLAYKISQIATGYRLDESAVVRTTDIVTLTILGLIPKNRLAEEFSISLGLSNAEAQNLMKQIDKDIFLNTKEIVRIESERLVEDTSKENTRPPENTIPAPKTQEERGEAHTDRDQILAEIENPTPVIHPISVADQTLPGPATPREIVPETKTSVTNDFISGKLTETLKLPAQKVTINPEQGKTKTREYSNDPYREPLA